MTSSSSTAKPRRTQEERRAISEQAVLTAAFNVMKVKGVAGLTMGEIASAAGVSKGLVVHLFGNKQGLLLGMLGHIRTSFQKRMRESVTDQQGVPFLRGYIRAIIHSLESPDSSSRIFSALLSEAIFQDREFATEVAHMNNLTIKFVRDCLEFEQERGMVFEMEDLNSVAILIVASLRGIAQIYSINASAGLPPIDTSPLLQMMEATLDHHLGSAIQPDQPQTRAA